MSIFSGRCDLFDTMSGLAGWYDKNGNKVNANEGTGPYYSDEYQDFLEFKRRTKGVLLQSKRITVTEWNQNEISENLGNAFEIIPHTKTVPDKRTKSKERTETTYTYKYYNKEYTLKELNKKGVYIHLKIHFNTILDLIPYYPYIVSACASSEDSMTVFIGSEPYPLERRNDLLKGGHISHSQLLWYNSELQNHYRDIVLKYFNPEGREHIEKVYFDDSGVGKVSFPIDENFDVSFVFPKDNRQGYFNSPMVIDANKGIIDIGRVNVQYLGNELDIYYVEQTEYKLNLK